MYIVISLAVILTTAIVVFFKRSFSYWKTKGLNYLEPSIPFGNASNFFMGKVSFGVLFHDWYLECKKRGWKAGGCYFGGRPLCIPVDQTIIKAIVISDFWTFPNHGLYISEDVEPLSGHIFNMEDHKWKNLRAKIPTIFTTAKMKRNVLIMERISREFVKRLEAQTCKTKSLNVKEEVSRFTIDIVTACAFGMESNTLKGENSELVANSRFFFDSQWSRLANTLVVMIPRHVLSFFHFKYFPSEITNYFMNMFAQIKEYRQKEKSGVTDLTDLLIDLCDETKEHSDFNGKGSMDPLTFNEFASQMYVFFEAGFETSSGTQTFALYELAFNPDVQDKLRDEINSVLSKYDGKIGYDAVNEMNYLDRVVDETLRKYPVFPILPRACVKDYKLPGTDVTLETNSFVLISNLGIHYDPEYYPDPMKFDPERFTQENKAKRPHCAYMPFGEGPRICVGKRFGLWQTKIGIATIIRNFKVTLSDKMLVPLKFDTLGLILKAKGDVWLNFDKIIDSSKL